MSQIPLLNSDNVSYRLIHLIVSIERRTRVKYAGNGIVPDQSEEIMAIKKVGILTGGGDCSGLNAVIRAVTRSAIIEHGAKVIGIEGGFEGLVVNRTQDLKIKSTRDTLRYRERRSEDPVSSQGRKPLQHYHGG